MAVDNTKKSYPFMEFPLSMARQDAFPLDKTTVFKSPEDAQNYARTDPTAYVGQHLSVVIDGVSTPYHIKNEDGELEALGGAAAEDVATDEEVEAMLDEVFAANKE